MNPDLINWWAVLVAALSMFLLGGLWYSPVLFQKAWMRANGFEAKDVEGGNPAVIFGVSFVLRFFAR